jgi:hypothetical protein
MQNNARYIFFIGISILFILVTGCIFSINEQTPPSTQSPSLTQTPQIVYVVVTVTPTIIPTSAVISTGTTPILIPTNVTTIPTETTDPILHRWINITKNVIVVDGNLQYYGAELQFYSDGYVKYDYGISQEISSNYAINNPNLTWTGTWSKVGNNQYIAKMLDANQSLPGSTPTINNIYYYPAGTNPLYPGITFPAHLVAQQGTSTVYFYPAKSDIPPT